MEGFESSVYSKNVIEFVTVANEFCKFIECAEGISVTEFVDKSHKLFPFLYLKATMLPKLEESYEEFNEKYVTEQDYNYINESLQAKFGKHNFYDEIFDPLRQENDEPAQLSIAESIADIYQDLKDFIMQFQVGTVEVMVNAVWECQQTFEQYWGQRIVNVLRVLHHLKYNVVELEDNTDKQGEEGFGFDNIDTSNWLISRLQDDYKDEE
jgi:thiol-disulfide isomerase/thioredoxin